MTLFFRTYPESKNIGYDIPYLYKLLRGTYGSPYDPLPFLFKKFIL